MDIIRTFGLSCVVSIVALFLNLFQIHLEETDNHPILERILPLLIFLLFFISIPSTAVLYFLMHQYDKRLEKLVRKEEREKCDSLMSIDRRLLLQSDSDLKSAKDTILFLRSEIDDLKEDNANLKTKFNQLQQDKIAENDPLVMSLRKSAYEHGWSSGHRSGFYDGYIDCKSDISQSIDRTDELYEYAHSSDSEFHLRPSPSEISALQK